MRYGEPLNEVRAMPAAKVKSRGKTKPAKTRQAPAGGRLLARLAAKLGVGEAAVVARALRELADRVALTGPKGPEVGPKPLPLPARRKISTAEDTVIAGDKVPHGAAPSTTIDQQLGHAGGLPKRLYLLLHGRGLDGAGRPVEVINFPCVIGSARSSTIWLNAPNVEARHVRISETGDGWVLEDLGTQRGTFLADGERVTRRTLRKGDSFLVAGHERMAIDIR